MINDAVAFKVIAKDFSIYLLCERESYQAKVVLV